MNIFVPFQNSKNVADLPVLSKQVMLQQFYFEQKTRTEGGSGLKVTRVKRMREQRYFEKSHVGYNYFTDTENGYSVI